ncbi:hypothetical protein [Streptomyces sp. NBC_00199]|uniref:hypothetical protein n=1 Tax=Streptomyces sp. NBC_00199 TaxID=2975678 RepID=UPI002259C230|nr:hypothetical protein [Streptomyces sp. NBC_00199]MCX5264253.1 hypothetical protein [Streptomyces sp. NBC_00199]
MLLGIRYRGGDQRRQECGDGEFVEDVEFDQADLGVDGAVEAAQREFRDKVRREESGEQRTRG